MKTCLATICALLYISAVAQQDPRLSPDPNKSRPIAAVANEVFMENMTWMEVRDAMKQGKTTAIIATGGLEMNGPYLVTNKHNIVCRVLSERIAKELGNALVATVVPYVPEGDFDPATGHMRYPGTIGVSEETFQALLTDIARSLKATGFKNIVLIGDSGGNTKGMQAVATKLSKKWNDETGIYHIPEFYDNTKWNQWLEQRGILEKDEGIHDSYRYTAMVLLGGEENIRSKQRRDKSLFSINGVQLDPIEQTIKVANELADYTAEVTAEAIKNRIK